MKKLKQRGQVTYGHTVFKQQSWKPNPGNLAPASVFFINLRHCFMPVFSLSTSYNKDDVTTHLWHVNWTGKLGGKHTSYGNWLVNGRVVICTRHSAPGRTHWNHHLEHHLPPEVQTFPEEAVPSGLPRVNESLWRPKGPGLTLLQPCNIQVHGTWRLVGQPSRGSQQSCPEQLRWKPTQSSRSMQLGLEGCIGITRK
jgi:hypothetical protein